MFNMSFFKHVFFSNFRDADSPCTLIKELTENQHNANEDRDRQALWDAYLDFDLPYPVSGPFCIPDGVGDSPSMTEGLSYIQDTSIQEEQTQDNYTACLTRLCKSIAGDFLQHPQTELSIVNSAVCYIQHLVSLLREDYTSLRDHSSFDNYSDGSSTRSSDSPPHSFKFAENNGFHFSPEHSSSSWIPDVHPLLSRSPSPEGMIAIKALYPMVLQQKHDFTVTTPVQSIPQYSCKTSDLINDSETVSQSMFDAWTSLKLRQKPLQCSSSSTEDVTSVLGEIGKERNGSKDDLRRAIEMGAFERGFVPIQENTGSDLSSTLDDNANYFGQRLTNCQSDFSHILNGESDSTVDSSDFSANLDSCDRFEEELRFQLNNEESFVDNPEINESSMMEQFSREYPALASVLLEQSKKGLGSHWRQANTEFDVATQTLEADSATTTFPRYKSCTKICRTPQVNPVRVSKKTSKGPKRPKNGFIRFSVEQRRLMADEHPRLDNREVSRMLGAKWRKMSYDERQPYERVLLLQIEYRPILYTVFDLIRAQGAGK
ncbi:uncharacterized protein LOC117338572 [Pecten maximus]|uniref:uncharacterized protein LOC117338572 n=1 Tax=Pecten maximus TaxID=6579 RepID=UPI001457F297|nr:uncharacterized protein LOC117338572 [Pecten maximus]